jgi:hypothetical protein
MFVFHEKFDAKIDRRLAQVEKGWGVKEDNADPAAREAHLQKQVPPPPLAPGMT